MSLDSHLRRPRRLTAVLMIAGFSLLSAAASAQDPPADDEGWLISDQLILHGNPRKGARLSLRRQSESDAAKLRVVLIVESGGAPQEARGLELTLDGERTKVACRVVGRQSVFHQIDAQPFDKEISATHATSDCPLEPATFQSILSASAVTIEIDASAEPLKKKTLRSKQLRRLVKLEAPQ